MVTDTVIEMEELQVVLAGARERGFVTAASLRTAVEEAELSSEQTQDLFSYLEEHAIEIVDADEPGAELHAGGGAVAARIRRRRRACRAMRTASRRPTTKRVACARGCRSSSAQRPT